MKRRTRRDFLGGIFVHATLGLTLGLGACAVRYDERSPYVDYPNYYYDYYFYPHIGVYFHLFSGDYYLRQQGRWQRTRVLPRGIWLDEHYRVPLHFRGHQPYKHYDEHRSKHAKPKDWQRGKQRSRGERVERDRRERQHNFGRHGEYHRKRRQ